MSVLGSIRERRDALFTVALTGAFFLIALAGILRHEMWRDELQAWMLARDSASVIELIRNLEFEGHPALWHLLLFALSRFSSDPQLMQVAHVVIATISVYLIARHSPFETWQKVLLAFGYFNVYEYAIISRGYALGVLLVFAFCALHARRHDTSPSAAPPSAPTRELLPFLMLAALANTSVYGLLVSAALSISLLWPRARARRERRWHRIGIALLVAAWALCYLQVSRINRSSGGGRHLAGELSDPENPLVALVTRLSVSLSYVWRGYVPVPALSSEQPWNSNVLLELHTGVTVAGRDASEALVVLGSLLLLALACRALASRPRWLTVYAVGTGLLLVFQFLFFGGSLRHHGHLFILLIACLWLARAEASREAAPVDERRHRGHRRQGVLLSALLIPQVAAGLFFYVLDWSEPFSGSRDAAAIIRQNGLEELPIVGYRDRETSTLSAYLDVPLYYPNRRRLGSYWTTKPAEDQREARQAIGAFVSANGGPVVLVLTRPLEADIAGISYETLGSAHGALARRESFHLYLATADTERTGRRLTRRPR